MLFENAPVLLPKSSFYPIIFNENEDCSFTLIASLVVSRKGQKTLSIGSIWNDKMNIGIEPLDDHHKTIVRLMLEVKAELDGKKHSADIQGILASLISYSKYHFLSEERIMLEKNFPHLEQQRTDHKWFVERLDEITAAYPSDDAVFNQELFEHLKDWFVKHILTRDVFLKSFMDKNMA